MEKPIKHQDLYVTYFAIKISVSVLWEGTCSDSFSKDRILVMQRLFLNLFIDVLAYKVLQ